MLKIAPTLTVTSMFADGDSASVAIVVNIRVCAEIDGRISYLEPLPHRHVTENSRRDRGVVLALGILVVRPGLRSKVAANFVRRGWATQATTWFTKFQIRLERGNLSLQDNQDAPRSSSGFETTQAGQVLPVDRLFNSRNYVFHLKDSNGSNKDAKHVDRPE